MVKMLSLTQDMTTSKKLAVILFFIVTSQILRLYIESSLLLTPVLVQVLPPVTRVIPSSSDQSFGGKYFVNKFYKSEGFGVDDVTPNDVTLVLHGSVDKLHKLIEISQVWDGPISISIFAPDFDSSFFDDAIDGLRLCWRKIRKQTTFHLVSPVSHQSNVTETGKFVYLSCKDITRRLRLRKTSFGYLDDVTYPHNVMRNVARSGAMTSHIFEIDADVIPSPGLWLKLNKFLRQMYNESRQDIINSRELFVVPVFEVKQGVSARNKVELKLTLEEKNARPFLQEICGECHGPTNSEQWLSHVSNNSVALNILYDVDFIRGWEPFFVSSRFLPDYDVTFNKYGHDRLSYICLLQATGYKFKVLSDEFLVYNGYRTKNKITSFERIRKNKREAFNNEFAVALKQNGYVKKVFQKC